MWDKESRAVRTTEDTIIRAMILCFGGIIGITALTGIVLSSARVNSVSADTNTTDSVSITIPSACTMSGSGMDSHTATIEPGTWSGASGSTYENGIGTTTLTTFCNDANGFAIYAIGATNADGANNTDLVGQSTGQTIITGTASTGNTSNWSMKVNKVDDNTAYMPAYMYIDNSYNAWHTVPSSYQRVAYFNATTGPSSTDTTLGAKVTTTYAAYATSTQVADTYEGQVKYIMVHPNTFTAGTYSITYNANGGSGTMEGETNIPNYDDHTLATSTFTPPTGKVLSGWCTTNTSQSECSDGEFYKPTDAIAPSTVASNTTLNLYAIWGDPPTMQAFAANQLSTTCSNMSVGDTTTLADSRDGIQYHIGKLADDKCWMLDNLALDVVAKIDDMNENNTNASNTTLGYLKNGGGSTTDSDPTYKYASDGVTNWTSSYSYSAPLVNISNKDIVPSNAPTNGQGNNKVGGYYNYCAATAGSYCYGSGTSAGASTGNATEDICPKGWRLPTGSISGEFSALANQIYGSTSSTSDTTAVANYRNALSLPLSGYFDSGSPDNQGSNGGWWSSMRISNGDMYSLYVYASSIYPAGSGSRDYGNSIRCTLE